MATPPENTPGTPIPILLLVAGAATIIGAIVGSQDTMSSGFSTRDVVVVSAFLCAVTFVGLAGLSYTLRQHEVWREHLRRRGE